MRSRLRIAAFVLGFLYASTALARAQQYYESDAGGLALRPISAAQRANFEYVLEKRESKEEVIQRLLKNGVEIRRIVAQATPAGWEESVFENGELISRIDKREGIPVEERIYRAGALSEIHTFTYVGKNLTETVVTDGEGREMSRTEYDRTSDGRMYRSLVSTTDSERTSIYRFDSEGLYEIWLGDARTDDSQRYQDGLLYRYRDDSLTHVERWRAGNLERLETIDTTALGTIRTIDDYKTGEKMVRTFTPAGRLVDENVFLGDAKIEQTRYRYEGDTLIESIRVFSGGSESRMYEYDGSDALVRETVLVDSIIQRVIVYTGEKERYEDIYRDGIAMLRVYFSDGRKVREELLR